MKKIQKMIVSLVVAAVAMTATTPVKNANAGVVLIYGGSEIWEDGNALVAGLALFSIGVASLDIPGVGLAEIILDADGNLNRSKLEKAFSDKYPFINDHGVIRELAATIREKAAMTPIFDGKRMVSLSPDETRDILAPTGLTDNSDPIVQTEVQSLITDLK